ncbi:MAG TPA: hypothetical protein VHD56_14210 [Tepidisphaeraceae bacterium]|nr:hypothetical protein [Tepidisphaeraceae bacterium]
MSELPEEQPSQDQPIPDGPIVAGPGVGYRIKFSLFALLLIGMGAWFGYDGFVGWPNMNERLRVIKLERDEAIRTGNSTRSQALLEESLKLNNGQPKTDWDLGLQKFLCLALPVVGIALGLRALHNSRGEYRLENGVLTVPGHPPVPLENMTELDRRLWDRKGIAYLTYDLGAGQQGTLRLDDYFHERVNTDLIFERVEKYISGLAQEKAHG